ncbi:type IX secretion system membrane protein PorP/SprF [Flavobacterium sp.]|uniref:PorP/SprF family type IX secretion system membrane protein n=1 Tax=Flavobacterium sp. TaxID=239 RepID=UPI00286D895C|nr:type IX secretion system membrane protein PorP/SprF [Flavobacterium sp.]
MKLKLIIFGFILLSAVGTAQQEAQYTQYMYNTANINPAYAGSRGVLSVLAMHRTQWVGLDGAPTTNTITMHTPVSERIGLGLSLVNDELGPSDENTFSVDLSYNVPTSESFKLAFGIKATANLFNVDFGKLNTFTTADLLNNRQNIDNRFFPNVGAGIFWYSNKTYLGVSIPYMLERKYYDNDVQFTASERMHIHAIGGYVFDLSNNLKFKPAALVKLVKGAPLQVDLSANFLFNEKFTLGAAYRWSAAMSVQAGFQISDSWLIGYAYDKDTTRLGSFNSGSHEIFLRYELFKSYSKVVSPRFF